MPSRRRFLTAVAAGASVASTGCSAIPDDSGDSNESTDDGDSNDIADDGDTPAAEAEPAPGLVSRLEGEGVEVRLFDSASIESVGRVQTTGNTPFVPVTLTEEGTATLTSTIRSANVTADEGTYEAVLERDGETVYSGRVTEGLLREWQAEDWSGQFQIQQPTVAEAQDLRLALTADEAP